MPASGSAIGAAPIGATPGGVPWFATGGCGAVPGGIPGGVPGAIPGATPDAPLVDDALGELTAPFRNALSSSARLAGSLKISREASANLAAFFQTFGSALLFAVFKSA